MHVYGECLLCPHYPLLPPLISSVIILKRILSLGWSRLHFPEVPLSPVVYFFENLKRTKKKHDLTVQVLVISTSAAGVSPLPEPFTRHKE